MSMLENLQQSSQWIKRKHNQTSTTANVVCAVAGSEANSQELTYLELSNQDIFVMSWPTAADGSCHFTTAKRHILRTMRAILHLYPFTA
jgi:hypothetical protein